MEDKLPLNQTVVICYSDSDIELVDISITAEWTRRVGRDSLDKAPIVDQLYSPCLSIPTQVAIYNRPTNKSLN